MSVALTYQNFKTSTPDQFDKDEIFNILNSITHFSKLVYLPSSNVNIEELLKLAETKNPMEIIFDIAVSSLEDLKQFDDAFDFTGEQFSTLRDCKEVVKLTHLYSTTAFGEIWKEDYFLNIPDHHKPELEDILLLVAENIAPYCITNAPNPSSKIYYPLQVLTLIKQLFEGKLTSTDIPQLVYSFNKTFFDKLLKLIDVVRGG